MVLGHTLLSTVVAAADVNLAAGRGTEKRRKKNKERFWEGELVCEGRVKRMSVFDSDKDEE